MAMVKLCQLLKYGNHFYPSKNHYWNGELCAARDREIKKGESDRKRASDCYTNIVVKPFYIREFCGFVRVYMRALRLLMAINLIECV